MDNLFLVVVLILLALAVFDLIVGVSNDAVNFLTSAIGARAGSFRLIMIVASIGILAGASSAGGMMEIAKNGVFTPKMLSFQDILFIYIVVMMTDVLILDLFNSLKLPTSTTISIVFELLGASLAISMLKMYEQNEAVSALAGYINSTKALQMIVAIFVSVFFAFFLGWLGQFIVRSIVTFNYKGINRTLGAVLGGISVAIITNFVFRVAFKHSPLKYSQVVMFLNDNAWTVSLIVFIVFTMVFYILANRKGFDPFRFVTLLGTFALAMAFASNDLVNFIGVPLASFEAYTLWVDSGIPADEFSMEAFMNPVDTSSFYFLLLAGMIMITTLWLSKKARNVVQTSVDLSRRSEGMERFRGNEAVRNVVSFFSFISGMVIKVTPNFIVQAIERRFERKTLLVNGQEEPVAFDMVRASVNLIVAAFLISLGTSLKLPLSTTYVSFMVLMGTSLADRAWNRDSAVYRVSGVFTVVGGWFLTALSALLVSGIFATVIFYTEFVGVGIVIAIVLTAIYLVNKYTDNRVKEALKLDLPEKWYERTPIVIIPHVRQRIKGLKSFYIHELGGILKALKKEDKRAIRKTSSLIQKKLETNYIYISRINDELRMTNDVNLETSKLLLTYYNEERRILDEFQKLADITKTHILNMHQPLNEEQYRQMTSFTKHIINYLNEVEVGLQSGSVPDDQSDEQLRTLVDQFVKIQVQGISVEYHYNLKNSLMYFHYFLTTLECSLMIKQISRLTT
jgi:phosphate/sulfate permease